MHKRFKSRGFSLVELLIVISVIGILAGLVTSGYVVYIKNGKKTQIASSVSAYQSALKSAVFEDDTIVNDATKPQACLSSDSSRCCVASGVGQDQVTCAKNGENSFSSSIYGKVERYLPKDKKPSLGDIQNSTLSACSAAITAGTAPCDSHEVAYSANYIGDGAKGALIYFLPASFDCQSGDVMVFNSSDSQYHYSSGATFSRRVNSGSNTFTECVVGIR